MDGVEEEPQTQEGLSKRGIKQHSGSGGKVKYPMLEIYIKERGKGVKG